MRMFYVNGEFVEEKSAYISVLDRGFLMADAIYEVVPVIGGKLANFDYHFARMSRSLGELDITNPFTPASLKSKLRELVARNKLTSGRLYLQITRGAMERDFAIVADLTPSVVAFTQAVELKEEISAINVVTRPDLRWGRGDIKTTQLLYASLMKTEALKAGADDCWLIRDGVITEGSSNNAYIIKDGVIRTHPASNLILGGITRAAILRLCENSGLAFEETVFSLEEAKSADEAFITSASAFVTAVGRIDDAAIGDGKPGPIATKLRKLYLEMITEAAE